MLQPWWEAFVEHRTPKTAPGCSRVAMWIRFGSIGSGVWLAHFPRTSLGARLVGSLGIGFLFSNHLCATFGNPPYEESIVFPYEEHRLWGLGQALSVVSQIRGFHSKHSPEGSVSPGLFGTVSGRVSDPWVQNGIGRSGTSGTRVAILVANNRAP